LRLSAAGLAGSAAHPPLRGRPQTRRRVRAVTSQSNIIEDISPRSGQTRTAPLHGATQTGVWRKAERRPGCRANGAAPPVEAKARPPPARQGERQECQRVRAKTPHPQGARSAGKSASLENPAHSASLPIVTRRAKTTGLVRAAHRAGCPPGSARPSSAWQR
jgi:hypothetical protein